MQLWPQASTDGPDEVEKVDREEVKRQGEIVGAWAEARVLQRTCSKNPARGPTARHGARGLHRKGEHRKGQWCFRH